MKKPVKIILIVACVGILGASVAMRVMKPEDEIQTKEIPAVTLDHAVMGNVEHETSIMGSIQPSDTYTVTPKVSGEIIEIYVQNGDTVKQGDPIARIDNKKSIDSAKATLEAANASARSAQDQADTAMDALNRMTPLYEAGDIAPQTFKSTQNSANAAQSQVTAAKAQAESAKLAYDTQVEYATVTAPADGTIQSQDMTLNSTVSQSSQLCVITGTGQKTIKFNVTEDVLNNLSIGDTVTVEKNSSQYEGTISKMSRYVDSSSGLFPVEADLKSADSLADGVAAKVRFISQKADNTLIIPVDYVYYSSGNQYVYVYSDGIVKKVYITVGISDDKNYQVLDGITESDQIVSSWTDEIYDGSTVRIVDSNGNVQSEASAN